LHFYQLFERTKKDAMEEILKSRAINGFCRAKITICESPSRITCLRFRDIAKEMAS